MKSNQIIFFAALLGALAVILGAFGAHKLEEILEPQKLDTYKLGVNYQYIHTLALLSCGIMALLGKENIKLFGYAAYCFITGIVLFSGTLYLLSFREIIDFGSLIKIIGPLTPVGGIFFIVGWLIMGFGALKLKIN